MAEVERNNLPVAEEPEFTKEIPAINPNDPVHFAQMNRMLASLLGNDVFLEMMVNKVKEDVTQLYSDLGGFEPIIDDAGKITGYKTAIGGADAVFPFSEIDKNALLLALSSSGLNINADSTPEEIYGVLALAFPGNINSSISVSANQNNALNKILWVAYPIQYNLTGYKTLKFSCNSSFYCRRDPNGDEKYRYDSAYSYVGVGKSNSVPVLSDNVRIGYGTSDMSHSWSGILSIDITNLDPGNYYIMVGMNMARQLGEWNSAMSGSTTCSHVEFLK